jgi:hypothetical protein
MFSGFRMYGFVFEDERMSIPVGDNIITIYYSPFKMEFYATDVLQLVLDGTYLTFEDSLDQAFAFASHSLKLCSCTVSMSMRTV